MEYTAPVNDMLFMLRHVGGMDAARREGWLDEPGDDMLEALLDQAGRFAAEQLAPLNATGDREGARIENGQVRTPQGFREAYRSWIEGGWNAVTAPEEWGGSGMPCTVGTALMEMWTSANMGFSTAPVLTQGAIHVMLSHADNSLRQIYLPKLVSGEWTATMSLTEPQAGSDLSAISTRAEPDGNDTFRLRGQKIFITYGEHDFTDNIVHLVLARLPGAPTGTKGISLFLVPKLLPASDGGESARNDVRCTGIEHKLGIHASPTCSMAFGDREGAIGWLVGSPNNGLACMFTMMNEARLSTGLQGVAIAERAFQQASAYAEIRKQGRDEAGESVPIVRHPDVRRMLRTMRALTLAGRAVAYTAAEAIDRSQRAPDAGMRRTADARAALLTPIVKAFSGEVGFDVASLNVQVHGGMGFVEETGAAQHLRDSRIISIYEGTNGIQAIDLVMRKVKRDGGTATKSELDLFRRIREELDSLGASSLGDMSTNLSDAIDALDQATDWVLAGGRSADELLAVATPYLRLFGLTAAGAYLAKGVTAALREAGAPPDFVPACRFYAEHLLIAAPALARTVMRGAGAVLEQA